MRLYRFMRALVQFMLHLFYRQVEVVGREHVPVAGPVIFVGNHPNSLVDPMLVIATSERVVCFAAKDTLFRNRVARALFTSLGAVPIRRRQDHGGPSIDNDEAFQALYQALSDGHTIGIFPEGISHDGAQLAQLKTGAARLALGFAAEHPGAPLAIVPCGLSYVHRRLFRSRVVVRFGEPVQWPVSPAESDPQAVAQVRGLTEAIDTALRRVTINAEDWNTLRVLHEVRRLYQPPRIPLAARIELARRFAEVYPRVADERETKQLFAEVRDYLDRKELAGLSDDELRHESAGTKARWRIASRVLSLLLWLPLALPGAVLHAPIGILVVGLTHRLARRKDTVAATKLLAAAALSAVIYLGMVIAAAVIWGWVGLAATMIALPLTGVATVRFLDRFHAVRRIGARTWRALLRRHAITELRAQRLRLQQQVLTMVDRYRPADMTPLFPRTPSVPHDS